MKSKVDILVAGKVKANYLDLDTLIEQPAYSEGRMFYNNIKKTYSFFNDESETTGDILEELRVRVYNNNGVTILNGQPVTVVGTQPNGVVQVELAIASNKESALNTIGIATHDIEVGTYGWATTAGMVSKLDTSLLTQGAPLYLSDSVAGTYQETRPTSPSYEVRMGGVAVSSNTVGEIYTEIRIISNDQDNNSFYNGAVLEPNNVLIVSNGTTVNCAMHSLAANNRLSLIFNQEYISVASGININLPPGTDSIPIEYWVYITPAGTITFSTVGFPTGTQYCPVARVRVPSATFAQLYGLYKSHAYTDHLSGSSGQGHLSHSNNWIRHRPAQYQSGVALTKSVADGTPATTINLAYTAGTVSQLHDHTFPPYDTATKPAFVINDFTTKYQLRNGISSAINADSTGASIDNNKYYTLVVWGVISEETKDCKLFFNLPKGTYTNITDAINDVDKTIDYTIPPEYLGTGFLISKITIQRGTTLVTAIAGGTSSLLGSIPGVGGGSVIGGAGIILFDELTDTPITKVGQALKFLRVNAAETALEYTTFNTDNIAYTNLPSQVLQSTLFAGLVNTAGAADHTRVDGYGVLMNRASSYITNAGGGSLIFGLGATHNADTKLTISAANSIFTNALSASNLSGTNSGDQNIAGIATNASAITAIQGEQTTQNSAIALNTAKVTNATHTGDVTGSTVLTIANGAIDIAHLSDELAGIATLATGNNVIDFKANIHYDKAIDSAWSPTFSNPVKGKSIVILTTGTVSYTLTLPASIKGDVSAWDSTLTNQLTLYCVDDTTPVYSVTLLNW